jgi:hypothetical protein
MKLEQLSHYEERVVDEAIPETGKGYGFRQFAAGKTWFYTQVDYHRDT